MTRLKTRSKNQILAALEEQYSRLHKADRLQGDPLCLLDRALAPNDLEIVSFLIAGLSYGRVEQIQKSSRLLFEHLSKVGISSSGAQIAEYLKNDFSRKQLSSCLKDWKHRLNTKLDLIDALESLRNILLEHGSLAAFFQKFSMRPSMNPSMRPSIRPRNDIDLEQGLAQFSQNFSRRKHTSKLWQGTGSAWFAPSPQDGSTCKRILMWLRWMLRQDEIDPGTWLSSKLQNPNLPQLNQGHLFWPVDTHVFQWAQKNKLSSRKSLNWALVKELTEVARELNPSDPLKYDFSICQQGMLNFRKPKRTGLISKRTQ